MIVSQAEFDAAMADVRGFAPPPMRKLIREVAFMAGIEPEDITGPSHKRRYARPRQLVMWKAYTDLGLSTPVIARELNRDHTTVLYGIDQVQSMMDRAND